jgi:hypothetical protein
MVRKVIVAHDLLFIVGCENAGVDCRPRGIESKHERCAKGRDDNCISGRSQSLAGTGSPL